MKKMRKLIPAFCMLLLSAVMLSTSTFAWFSMNTKVTATGMSVKATTNANLYIKEGIIAEAASINGIVANMSTTQHTLKPADLTDATGTVTVRVPDEWTTKPTVSTPGSASTWTTKGTFTKTTDTATLNATASDGIGNYIAAETMTLVRKAETNDGKADIDAKVTVNISVTSALNGALRCGFLVNTTWTESTDASISGTTITWTFNDLITELADNTVQTVTFVVWFEGEDSDCFSNNAITLSSNSIEIEFNSKDHPTI